MNELSEIFKAAQDGDCITLENKIYEIAPEDSFRLKGFFFSNTAKHEENPNGERFCAVYLNRKSNITIDGNGAKVMIHGKMTPCIFCECSNIVMQNICFEHYRPTMSEFTVTDSAPGYAEIHIDDEYIYRTDGNMLYWCGDNNKNSEPYWEIPYKGKGVLTNAFNPSTQVIEDMICGNGDDVIRYEPVVMDKSSATPVHKRLILKNNRFVSGTGRSLFVNLNYLDEAVIEGNASDVELKIINYRKAENVSLPPVK